VDDSYPCQGLGSGSNLVLLAYWPRTCCCDRGAKDETLEFRMQVTQAETYYDRLSQSGCREVPIDRERT